jgi:hypothetical protein
MHRANPFWGAPHIHGELQKVGIEIAETTVAKYLGRRPSSPSPTWRTFLRTHLSQCASMDFFTVPTATFRVLFVLVILSHDRRRIVHLNVTDHPTERLIGTLRRECLDHVIVWNERSLRRTLGLFLAYYHEWRTHLSLDKDAPIPRAVQPRGGIIQVPHVCGLSTTTNAASPDHRSRRRQTTTCSPRRSPAARHGCPRR